MGLRTFEQAVAWANSKVANPGQDWSNLCQMFSHTCVGSDAFGDVDPIIGKRTARTAFQWGVANGVAHTSSPPPPGSLAYFDTGRTAHAVFVADGGYVYSTPFGSLTGTATGIRRVSFKAFPSYMGFISAVPEGNLDIRAAGTTLGSSIPPKDASNYSTSSSVPSATVDTPQYAANPGSSTSNSRIDTSKPWVPDQRTIVYNPPLVRSAMHNEGYGPASMTFFSGGEVMESAGGSVGLPNKASSMGRLGRIITEDYVPAELAGQGTSRFGFRFLYNPSSYAENIGVNTNVQASVAALQLSNSLSANASFAFSLYLNRIEDLRYTSYPGTSAYPIAVSQADWEGIQQYGTLWDIEYLMRTVNGAPRDTWRGNTADIGQMYGLPSRFYLGRGRRLRGRLMSVSLNHLMFSRSMVPILTEVQLNVMRYPDTLLDVGATDSFVNPNIDPVNTAQTATDARQADVIAREVNAVTNPNSPWPPAGVQTPGA
jgi:hypothetical protein